MIHHRQLLGLEISFRSLKEVAWLAYLRWSIVVSIFVSLLGLADVRGVSGNLVAFRSCCGIDTSLMSIMNATGKKFL
jgi:hypothetical protein